MPKGDRTGPEGKGPGTGRKDGLCSGGKTPGYMDKDNKPGSFKGSGQGRRDGIGRASGKRGGGGKGGR